MAGLGRALVRCRAMVRRTASRALSVMPAWARLLALGVWRSPQYLLIGFFTLWRMVISPLYGPTCKYYPSCSAYGLEAVRRHGAIRGSVLTVWRILRCNPWSLGGIDDVPPVRGGGVVDHDQNAAEHAAESPEGRVHAGAECLAGDALDERPTAGGPRADRSGAGPVVSETSPAPLEDDGGAPEDSPASPTTHGPRPAPDPEDHTPSRRAA